MAEKAATVREALRVICEARRDDLIQPGVLSQAWVGFELPGRAAAGGVAVVVLACSPLQRRVNKNTSACCLGEHKSKVKKETSLTMPNSIPNVEPPDIVVKRSCACTLALSEEKPVKEGWASEEGKAEMGGNPQLAGTGPSVEVERS
ncbi:hypothetical protein NDU88_001965 [Pleurodeles waltl]|uniref:Uncharacterized protein n=1 Tax=Pleurodeles waltl TaxID=8319 RepID=A0AAV7LED2_PLEWA|nr:hypothetical protein NDU88_001965 [Pleurodeles waltl]